MLFPMQVVVARRIQPGQTLARLSGQNKETIFLPKQQPALAAISDDNADGEYSLSMITKQKGPRFSRHAVFFFKNSLQFFSHILFSDGNILDFTVLGDPTEFEESYKSERTTTPKKFFLSPVDTANTLTNESTPHAPAATTITSADGKTNVMMIAPSTAISQSTIATSASSATGKRGMKSSLASESANKATRNIALSSLEAGADTQTGNTAKPSTSVTVNLPELPEGISFEESISRLPETEQKAYFFFKRLII